MNILLDPYLIPSLCFQAKYATNRSDQASGFLFFLPTVTTSQSISMQSFLCFFAYEHFLLLQELFVSLWWLIVELLLDLNSFLFKVSVYGFKYGGLPPFTSEFLLGLVSQAVIQDVRSKACLASWARLSRIYDSILCDSIYDRSYLTALPVLSNTISVGQKHFYPFKPVCSFSICPSDIVEEGLEVIISFDNFSEEQLT